MKEKTEAEWIETGNECRRRNDWKGAIEAYNNALVLNPESQARTARAMVEDILAFGNQQIYNV
ncbi:MAG: tetratricopeptide repeat protein [Bacteroidaceae bacterium]|nr:tetratricopeptide repeat protein [Bacteroidaceae bacterium]